MKIIEIFQTMFDKEIMPYILGLKSVSENINYYEPIIYTLEKKSNKFRSATCLIVADLCKLDKKQILPIAAISELIHSSIIIQDDIADNNSERRKMIAACKKYSTCHSLHASLFVIPACLKIIDSPDVKNSFLSYLQNVYKQQIGQSILTLNQIISYERFLEIHLGKTAIGQWAITSPAMIMDDLKIFDILLKFSQKLGDAGTLKNDVEDFMYEGFKDVKTGAVTYPIYWYFQQCSQLEKTSFLKIFGKNYNMDYNALKNDFINKGVYNHCLELIEILTDEANQCLRKMPDSTGKKLLLEWSDYHKNI